MLTRKVLGILSLWLNYILGDNIAIIAYLHLHYMHLADVFIQNDLQCIQDIHFLSVRVFSENWTHNLLRC